MLKELLENVDKIDSEDVAYIDSCAGDHVWRLDSCKYLKRVVKNRGKSVVGITGDRKPLTHVGEHNVLKRIYLGDVTTNLISLPKILEEGGTIYGNKCGCLIWDEKGEVIVKGIRGKRGMYKCNLKVDRGDNIKVMHSNIID